MARSAASTWPLESKSAAKLGVSEIVPVVSSCDVFHAKPLTIGRLSALNPPATVPQSKRSNDSGPVGVKPLMNCTAMHAAEGELAGHVEMVVFGPLIVAADFHQEQRGVGERGIAGERDGRGAVAGAEGAVELDGAGVGAGAADRAGEANGLGAGRAVDGSLIFEGAVDRAVTGDGLARVELNAVEAGERTAGERGGCTQLGDAGAEQIDLLRARVERALEGVEAGGEFGVAEGQRSARGGDGTRRRAGDARVDGAVASGSAGEGDSGVGDNRAAGERGGTNGDGLCGGEGVRADGQAAANRGGPGDGGWADERDGARGVALEIGVDRRL